MNLINFNLDYSDNVEIDIYFIKHIYYETIITQLKIKQQYYNTNKQQIT
jgi:hypothetical protein